MSILQTARRKYAEALAAVEREEARTDICPECGTPVEEQRDTVWEAQKRLNQAEGRLRRIEGEKIQELAAERKRRGEGEP